MTSVSGSSGVASLHAAKKAADVEFFATMRRKELEREAARKEAEKAQEKPVTVALGANAVTLDHEAASELAAMLSRNAKVLEEYPERSFELPGGGVATGAELSAVLSTLILAGKV